MSQTCLWQFFITEIIKNRLFTGWILLLAWVGSGTAASGQDQPAGLQLALAMQDAVVSAVQKAEKSIVSIARTSRPGGDLTEEELVPSRYGAGVILSDDGLILTNYHVIDETFTNQNQTFYQTPDGNRFLGQPEKPPAVRDTLYVWTHEKRPYQARVVAADPRSDLAVLKIPARGLTPVVMASVKTVEGLKKGELVLALGNPYAVARDGSASVAWGLVANIRRSAPQELDPNGEPVAGPAQLHHFGTLIQTDARLSSGTSGGALINLKGEMIGLTSSLPVDPGGGEPAGFAIPLDAAFRRAVETLKQGREVEYGFLGIRPRRRNLNRRSQELPGAEIEDVSPDYPGAEAGLQGRDLVVAINGQPVDDYDDLILLIGRLPAQAPIRLTVMRQQQRLELPEVQLAKYPVRGVIILSDPPKASRGIVVDFPSRFPRFAQRWLRPGSGEFRALRGGSVAVRDLVRDSPASEAGLQRMQLITHVNGTPVNSPEQFHRSVGQAQGPVRLKVAGRSEEIVVQ